LGIQVNCYQEQRYENWQIFFHMQDFTQEYLIKENAEGECQ